MNRSLQRLRAPLACVLVALAGEVIALSAFAQLTPQLITVANLADSGPGSLRQAITTANAAREPTTIGFAPGLAGTILLTGGELRITANVAIIGPGANTLAISGNNLSRVFTIESPAGSAVDVVTISGLTITGGVAGDNALPAGKGGGIYVQGAALTLSGVGIANNVAVGGVAGGAAGGGIYATASSVTVADTTISGNQAMGNDTPTVNGTGLGGGVMVDTGQLTLNGNTFAGNQAIGGSALGGAIAFTGGGNDTLTVDGNSFSGNQAQANSIGGSALGGGLFVSGKLAQANAVVRRTRLVGNIAGRGSRGGVSVGTSPAGGSGGASHGGGLYVDNLASVTLAQVLISGNLLYGPWDLSVNDAGMAAGAGAYVNTGGALTLNNTSVILNAALPNTLVGTGAVGNSLGGGVFVASGGTLALEGSTKVKQNFARNYPNLYPPGGEP
jgi:hypothetical protein